MTTQLNQQNGIHLNIRASVGGPKAGRAWIPVPDDGVPADLMPDAGLYLEIREGRPAYDRALGVDAPTWDCVRAEIVAERAKRAAALADEAKEKAARDAEKARNTASWRESAAKYIAGEQVSVWNVDGDISFTCAASSTSVTREEIRAVRAERDRREEAYREQSRTTWRAAARVYLDGGPETPRPARGSGIPAGITDDEIAAVAEEITRREYAERAAKITARREFLTTHAAPEDMIERFDAGVLPEDELAEFVRDAVLPAPFTYMAGGVQAVAYQPRKADDIEHDDDCNDERDKYGDIVDFEVEDADAAKLTASQWRIVKALRASAESIGAKCVVSKHTAELHCSCANQHWLSAKLVASPAGTKLEVVRRYALD